MKKKVLLMGKSGSGKTSMRSIIFANYIARDTMRLGATIDVEHSHVRFLGNLVLNLWDCLAEGTLVTLKNGVSIPIESVQAGMTVLGLSIEKKDCVVPRVVQAVLPRGNSECLELGFADGRTLTCTYDHRLLTDEGWAEAKDLKIGSSRVAMSSEAPSPPINEDLKPVGASSSSSSSRDLQDSLDIVLDMTEATMNVDASKQEHSLHFVPLVSSHKVGKKPVWDLAVPSGAGDKFDSFVANGMVVHNCGGQDAFMENYLESQRDHIFRNVEVLIYVFDIESREVKKDMGYYQSCLDALAQNSKSAKIFCLIHKMDLIPEDQRKKVFDQKVIDINAASTSMGPGAVTSFRTSIWDETLYKAWSSIVYSLIPNIKTLETNLDNFSKVCEADEVVLFEKATFLVIAHSTRKNHEDVHRFEKISNIIKQFKLSCSKSQAQFQSMEVQNANFAAFIEGFTSNTYIMVIMSDPAITSATTHINIQAARIFFEKFIQQSSSMGNVL